MAVKKQVKVYVEPELWDQVRDLAARMHLEPAVIARLAIREYVEHRMARSEG